MVLEATTEDLCCDISNVLFEFLDRPAEYIVLSKKVETLYLGKSEINWVENSTLTLQSSHVNVFPKSCSLASPFAFSSFPENQ